jgi:hypothetical protein
MAGGEGWRWRWRRAGAYGDVDEAGVELAARGERAAERGRRCDCGEAAATGSRRTCATARYSARWAQLAAGGSARGMAAPAVVRRSSWRRRAEVGWLWRASRRVKVKVEKQPCHFERYCTSSAGSQSSERSLGRPPALAGCRRNVDVWRCERRLRPRSLCIPATSVAALCHFCTASPPRGLDLSMHQLHVRCCTFHRYMA